MGLLISRREWGAKSPTHPPTRLDWSKIDAIAIHYSGAMADELPDYKQRVRGIQNFHMSSTPTDPSKPWNDIAYNYLVSRDGDKFVGRGSQVMSAATFGHNDHTVSICFLGGDRDGRDDVTEKGRRSISELIFQFENEARKKVTTVNAKHSSGPRAFVVSGHKVFTGTECPGKELTSFINTKGFEAYRNPPVVGYPDHFFNWAAWYLGEGPYLSVGPRYSPLRPEYPKMPVAPLYWLALKRFLHARNN